MLIATLPAPASAQGTVVPAPPYYAMTPSQPFAPQASSPVQQQVLENYRTQLLQTQREMLQQNPSGASREQFEVNRQLNAFNPALGAAPPAATGSIAPIPGTVPAPPFNAAPRP